MESDVRFPPKIRGRRPRRDGAEGVARAEVDSPVWVAVGG